MSILRHAGLDAFSPHVAHPRLVGDALGLNWLVLLVIGGLVLAAFVASFRPSPPRDPPERR